MERTTYMTNLMTSTYPNIAPEAVMNEFDGVWERLIAAQLKKHALCDHSEAQMILESVNWDHLKAAYLITSSKISENADCI